MQNECNEVNQLDEEYVICNRALPTFKFPNWLFLHLHSFSFNLVRVKDFTALQTDLKVPVLP